MAQKPKARELSPEELAAEGASELPDREAKSVLSVGGLSGALPDPAAPNPVPTGVPPDADLTSAGGDIGDISDVVDPNDVRTLMDPRDLADLRDVADVTGAPGLT